jgi:hypothetical protein
VAFLLVYIQEAHPLDGWQVEPNVEDGILFLQPTEIAARNGLARTCRERLSLSIPCVVDTIDNSVDNLYAGWPDRIFVVDGGGTVTYAGKMGPWGFDPQAAREAVARLR